MTGVGAWLAAPGTNNGWWMPEWPRHELYVALPSTSLLSESDFLEITSSPLKHMTWADHATALAYGADYALVLFLLAAWSFRRCSLARE